MVTTGIRSDIRGELLGNSVKIPKGYFGMGSLEEIDEKPVHDVFLSVFLVTKYHVTNRQYLQFLNAYKIVNLSSGTYEYMNPFNKRTRIRGGNKKYEIVDGYENHPVTGVNWKGSYAFAIWIGGRLPTEAEREKASRGSMEGE